MEFLKIFLAVVLAQVIGGIISAHINKWRYDNSAMSKRAKEMEKALDSEEG